MFPIEIHYTLTRAQRFFPHIKVWGKYNLIAICLVGVGALSASMKLWMILILVIFFGGIFLRNYFIGLVHCLAFPRQAMAVTIEEACINYSVKNGERYSIGLDGIHRLRDLEHSVWTLEHWNGDVLNIPKKCLSPEAVEFLREWELRAHNARVKIGLT